MNMKHTTLKIIISPAKKMKENDALPPAGLPLFLETTAVLLSRLQAMSDADLQCLWNCNDSIAALNADRIRHMNLYENLTPAILAYEGIQYKYMAPAVFEKDAYRYLEEHLYILSGFYGALKPFDGVTPYRLEMQARFGGEDMDSLYDFWGDAIARQVFTQCDGIVNLASKEYSKAVLPYLPEGMPSVTCVFGEVTDGKVKEKGTYAKMARGEMVRFMAEHKIETMDGLKDFAGQGYAYAEEHSSSETYVFVRQTSKTGK